MGKAAEDLRRILRRMQERLDEAPGPAVREVAAEPPAVPVQPPAGRYAPIPRLCREEAPASARPAPAAATEPNRGVLARLFGCGGLGASSRELQALESRLALLERRVDSLALSDGGRSVSGGLAEEMHELRTMVKSLYKVLEESAPAEEGGRDASST